MHRMAASGIILPASLDERVAGARRQERHVVAHVDFAGRGSLPSSEAPVTCSCGAVRTVDEWQSHLAEVRQHARYHRASTGKWSAA